MSKSANDQLCVKCMFGFVSFFLTFPFSLPIFCFFLFFKSVNLYSCSIVIIAALKFLPDYSNTLVVLVGYIC